MRFFKEYSLTYACTPARIETLFFAGRKSMSLPTSTLPCSAGRIRIFELGPTCLQKPPQKTFAALPGAKVASEVVWPSTWQGIRGIGRRCWVGLLPLKVPDLTPAKAAAVAREKGFETLGGPHEMIGLFQFHGQAIGKDRIAEVSQDPEFAGYRSSGGYSYREPDESDGTLKSLFNPVGSDFIFPANTEVLVIPPPDMLAKRALAA